MSNAGVRFRGLKEMDRALGKADRELRKDLRGRLRAVALIVATGARAKAQEKGLRRSGDLIRGIRPYALMGKAGVRSGAMHGGYNYPARLEYEGGNRGPGPRATLTPAHEENKDEVVRELERLLDDFADDFHKG